MNTPDPDELIRLIQRKKAPATPGVKITPLKVPLHEGALSPRPAAPALSPFMQALIDTVLGGANTPVPAEPNGLVVGVTPSAVAHTTAPPLTEVEVLQEIERQQKIAQVRYRIRHWNNDVFSVERTYEVPCSKILWSIPLPGDREREVVQCAAGHEVTAPAPWGNGTARGDLGRYPCFIFGFSFISQDGGVSMVNWPQGFTKS